MTRSEIKDLIMVILGQTDYDLMKAYDPETAEEPEYAEDQMERLIDTVEDHLKKLAKKLVKENSVKLKKKLAKTKK
ncbi:MAG: hypothetical protein HC880_20335 [Bacteroidia bacterium]|nr:hypothetical protein [Bacteroidia bacterium]